ncbi:MAG: hypothetical protein ACXAC5_24480 [Promethearchaeota archaeon]
MNPYHHEKNRKNQFYEEWDDYEEENIPYEEETDWDADEEYDMWADEDED